jgi:hypothetical protein
MTDMYIPSKPKFVVVKIEDDGKVRIKYADGHTGYLWFPEAIDLCRALVHAMLDYSVDGTNKKIVQQCEVL